MVHGEQLQAPSSNRLEQRYKEDYQHSDHQKKCLKKEKPLWEGTTGDQTHEMKEKTKLHATRDKTKKEEKKKISNMI